MPFDLQPTLQSEILELRPLDDFVLFSSAHPTCARNEP